MKPAPNSSPEPVPWTQNPKLLRSIDVASVCVMISQFALMVWVISHRQRYSHMSYTPWEGVLSLIQFPFFLFGFLWLCFRNIPKLLPWWRNLNVSDPDSSNFIRLVFIIVLLLMGVLALLSQAAVPERLVKGVTDVDRVHGYNAWEAPLAS